MKYFLAFLAVCFFSFDSNAQTQESQKQAKQYFQNQEYGPALEIWENSIQFDSSNLYFYEQAGLCAYRLGMFPQAKKYFLKIGSDVQFFKSAFINLASIFDQQENVPKAIKYNSMLRDSFPDNPIYYRKLGTLYLRAGIASEAFPKFAKALELNPNDLISVKSISEIFIANQQYEDADSMINYGLNLDPESISLSLLLAKNYYVQKMYDSTVVVFKALRGKLDFSNYHKRMMGYALLQIDSIDLAINYLERSLEGENNPEHAHYYLGNAYEIKEDFIASSHHYEKAIEEGTSNGMHTYHRNLARLYKEEKMLKEAIDNYLWAYKYNPDPILLFFLAQASDEYYKDKSVAINYYTRYSKSIDTNERYKKYARQRALYLKERRHLNVQN